MPPSARLKNFSFLSDTDVVTMVNEQGLSAEALFENAPCGLIVTGVEGTIHHVNGTFCSWIGYEREELVRVCKLQDLMTVGGRIFHQTHWLPLLHLQGSLTEVKLDMVHRDGRTVPMLMNAARRGSGEQARHEIALFAVQDRHKYERELLLARKRAEELAQKEQQTQQLLLLAQAETNRLHEQELTVRMRQAHEMAQLNEQLDERVKRRTDSLQKANEELRGFAQTLAHELSGPVVIIGMFSGKLEKILNIAGDDHTRYLAQRIRTAALQMGDYKDALLTLADISQSKLLVTDVDLSALAFSAFAGLQKRDPHRAVRLTVQENLQVRGDARLLGLMIDHLTDNAWKFTAPCVNAEISLTANQDAQGDMRYCVKDNGVGFNQLCVAKLFGNFQRLHAPDEFPGMGIGLASVARVVSRHRGRIWAESGEAQGAAFFFTLRADY